VVLDRRENLLASYGIEAIYHMTHINNVSSILRHGLLSHGNGRTSVDISNRAVNNRRNRIDPFYKKTIHSYVPFYINPKNAMLYVRKAIQEDIVIFSFDRELIKENGVLFTDGNAASSSTRFFKNLEGLSSLHWNCLHAGSWNNYPDGKRRRMAEVLVPNRVSPVRINKIICYSMKSYLSLKAIVNGSVKIEINSKFYF